MFDRSSQHCLAVYVGFVLRADMRLGQARSNEADQRPAQRFLNALDEGEKRPV